jgi:hypothetical protein
MTSWYMLALFLGIFDKIAKERATLINNFEGGRDAV